MLPSDIYDLQTKFWECNIFTGVCPQHTPQHTLPPGIPYLPFWTSDLGPVHFRLYPSSPLVLTSSSGHLLGCFPVLLMSAAIFHD